MIASLFVLALSQRFDTLRGFDATHALAPEAAERLHLYEALAACAPLPLSEKTAAFVAEQQRGARLQNGERAQTIWRELDALNLAGNVDDTTVVWPKSDEAWPGEGPIIAPVVKGCERQTGSLAAEYAALAAAAASDPVLDYERLRTAFLLGHFEREAQPPALAEPLAGFAELLVLEHRFAASERSPALSERYRALADKLPKLADALFVRQMQIAADGKDQRAMRSLAAGEVSSRAMDQYRLAMLVTTEGEDYSAILDDVVDAEPLAVVDDATAPANVNLEIVRERVRDAASRVAFARQTLAALENANGKARLAREVYRIATLAAARHNLATAKEAYVWILAHGKALSREIHTKLALVAMLTLDAPTLKKELMLLADAPGAEKQFGALVTAVRAGGVRDPSIILLLRQTIVQSKKALSPEAVTQMCADLDAAQKIKAMQISLSDNAPLRQPVPPPVHFEFPEPYSLLPAL